jgi:hypothetical protein
MGLRRRLFVPCVVAWAACAWIILIGTEPPLDPSAQAWAHVTSRVLLGLTAGAVLVWPASVLCRQNMPRRIIAGETLLLMVLLGACVVALRLPGGDSGPAVLSGAALLCAWLLLVGGVTAWAMTCHRAIGWFIAPAVLLPLVCAGILPSAADLLLGPLTAAWRLGEMVTWPPTLVLSAALLPCVLAALVWRQTRPTPSLDEDQPNAR